MTDQAPTLAEVLQEAMDSRLLDLHTALPGRVERYDADRQVADVKPMVRRAVRDEDGEKVLEDLPVIPSVPVQWTRGGGFFVSMPIAVGDTGLLIFCERSIDRWRSTGEDADPGDQRPHGLSGAVFVPGVGPSASPIGDGDASDMRLGRDGASAQIRITPTQVRLGPAATKKVARDGDPVQVTIPAGSFLIAATGGGTLNPDPVTVDGEITDGSDLVRAED